MHELSLCRSLLRIIEKKMSDLGAAATQRVTTIWLEIGALCVVDTAALQFYFPLVTKNTVAAGANLHILTVPAQANCGSCQQYVTIQSYDDACPLCGAYRLTVEQGTELIIKKMEIG